MLPMHFEWGKLFKNVIYMENLAGNGQLDYSEKRFDPMGSSAPTPGQYTCKLP